jgi:carbonic anhydrase
LSAIGKSSRFPLLKSPLKSSRKATQTHEPLPYFNEFKEYGFDIPNTIVITCLDPRCIPENYFNLKYGG